MKSRIKGCLTGNSVAKWYQQLAASLVVGGELELDLSQVTAVDTTSVALLISLLKLAKIRQCRLTFGGMPASLRRLVAVVGLEAVLPIVG